MQHFLDGDWGVIRFCIEVHLGHDAIRIKSRSKIIQLVSEAFGIFSGMQIELVRIGGNEFYQAIDSKNISGEAC